MTLVADVSYFLLVVFCISIVKNEYNLYNTDPSRNTALYHDCFLYFVEDELPVLEELIRIGNPLLVISYCIRPLANDIDSNNLADGDFSSLRFDELRIMNVTALNLISWSIPFDLVEDYQEYLNTTISTFASKVVNNCSNGWFGTHCLYTISPHDTFTEFVISVFFQKTRRPFREMFPLQSTDFTCYTQLKCDRCLDWREICDGKIDCSIDGADEQNCLDLEMNECLENEYRCHNGLCVPETFLNDYPFNPDCLDRSDEQEYGGFNFRHELYQNCYRDPGFRCEESYHLVSAQNFICGDGETSLLFQTACMNGRIAVHTATLFSFENNMDLSYDCWRTLICALHVNDIGETRCDQFCLPLRCTYNLQDNCHAPFVFFPQHAIFHDHIRFVYLTNKTILRRRFQKEPLPDYVCYDSRRCPFLAPTLQINGSVCKLITDFGISSPLELDQIFRACAIQYRTDNATNFQLRSLFQCPGTTKLISKHRLLDGIPDCYGGVDEMSIDTCSLNQKHRFVCHSENKCISPILVRDGTLNCAEHEDEHYVKERSIYFQEICDGFTNLDIHELINGQNETDETNCEAWPCDNMYTRCDETWSCLNGSDESRCDNPFCPDYQFPCILPNNFSRICLPISRVNDGIEDCLGASDERAYCRSVGDEIRAFKCWNATTCVGVRSLCEKEICTFENLDSLCSNISLLNVLTKLEYDEWVALKKHLYFVVERKLFQPSNNEKRAATAIERISRRDIILRQVSTVIDSVNKLDVWLCNRGVPILVRTKEKYRCFCPPRYYGDHCQFQSQRISLTLKVQRICAPSCQGVFGLVVTLFDHEQVIHSQEQVTYVPTLDCHTKINIYLLYGERPKDLKKNYTIRVDVYNKIEMSYHASWLLLVPFLFLPVNRISTVLTLPSTSITSRCFKFCAHGQCLLYVNTGKEFCLCNSGWSGEQCTVAIDCRCSSDSFCVGIIHNRSNCLCSLHKSGARCLLPSVCEPKACRSKQKICIPFDGIRNEYRCLCWQKFLGDQCDGSLRFEISFLQVPIPQALLIHLIVANGDSEPKRLSIHIKVRLDEDEAVLHLPNTDFNLLFGQVAQEYYLLIIKEQFDILSESKLSISRSNHCPHIRELMDRRILFYPLRRVKFYHTVCQQRLNLPCFHDEEMFMCLCTKERHANCFHFKFNMTYECRGLNECKNNGECFQDDLRCPRWIKCVCPECFYGNKCQLTTKGFSLSLDVILGYSIRPRVSFSHQLLLVKVATAATAIMFIVGLINGVVSILIFRAKSIREVGCGYYLFASSVVSLQITIIFTFKFLFFLLSQMSIVTNRTFLHISCISVDFLLRSFLALHDWLNGSVAIERALITIRGTSFNKASSRRIARFVIPTIAFVVIGSTVYDPIYRQLLDDEEDQRIWCIVQYSSLQVELFNSAMNIVHFILPFSINLISAIVIIVTVARQRTLLQKQISYRKHLCEQWRHHSHLIFSPIVLVLSAVPRLIISFFFGCMKTPRHPALFLAGYFISFAPPLLTLVVYILPSKTYKKEFDTLLKRYRVIFFR